MRNRLWIMYAVVWAGGVIAGSLHNWWWLAPAIVSAFAYWLIERFDVKIFKGIFHKGIFYKRMPIVLDPLVEKISKSVWIRNAINDLKWRMDNPEWSGNQDMEKSIATLVASLSITIGVGFETAQIEEEK